MATLPIYIYIYHPTQWICCSDNDFYFDLVSRESPEDGHLYRPNHVVIEENTK
jgi:hypothetical protein